MIVEKDKMYCPVCQSLLTASNKSEVDRGVHEGYIFVHNNVEHTEEDLQALYRGIQ